MNEQEQPSGTASSYYSDSDTRATGFDPAKCKARMSEVMALFNLLVCYAPENPDAVRFAAWASARKLRDEVKLRGKALEDYQASLLVGKVGV